MIKKLMELMFLFFVTMSTFAQTNTLGFSHVLMTNNTNEPINITGSLIHADSTLIQGKDWDGHTATLRPYETKQILWFSRNKDIIENYNYRFDLVASHPNYPADDIKLSFLEKGKKFGSDITTHLTLPQKIEKFILKTNGINEFSSHFWDNTFTVYARAWRPLNQFYDDFHIVIDKPENNILDTSSKDKLSVLTYNTQLMPFYAGVVDHLNHPDIRANDIPNYISQFDVVIMEELFDYDLRNTIIKRMNVYYPYHTHVVGDHSKKILTGGVIIFSKWPIEKEDQISYQSGSGWDKYAAKGAIYARINKDEKIYHVIGTHLQADGNPEDIIVRQQQLAELENFIERSNIPSNQPLLMGGDFNIDENDTEMTTLLATLHVNLPQKTGYPYSVDGDINGMCTGSGHTRIDFVFYSNLHTQPKITTNKTFILRALRDEKMWPIFDLSDHFPTAGYFDFSS